MATAPLIPGLTSRVTQSDTLEYKAPNINVKLKSLVEADPSATFDRDWIKSTFVITDKEGIGASTDPDASAYAQWIRKNRYGTSASHKFSSTSPGMSLGVNPKPQFTRYCDIRFKGRVESRPTHVSVGRGNDNESVSVRAHSTGLGLGGYYSEAIDDNQQRVFFRFGVPSYMPLPIWILKAFDIDKAVLQGRGTITATFIEAVKVVTKYFAVVGNPVLHFTMGVIGAISSSFRFYSVRPTMYIYWSTVETIMNSMVSRRTMLPTRFQEYTYKLQATVGQPEKVNQRFLDTIHEYIPDLVDGETGRISIFAIALRNQAAYNRIKLAEMNANDAATAETGVPDNVTGNKPFAPLDSPNGRLTNSLFRWANDFIMSGNKEEETDAVKEGKAVPSGLIRYSTEFSTEEGNPINISLDPNAPEDSIDKKIADNVNTKASKFDKYKEYLMAELSEGAAFAVFNVESTGSVGESFSSSFGSNPIESSFNAISAKARNLGSLLSGLKDIPFVGDALELAADTGAMILSTGTAGLANPLLALAYGVNISMPKVWESSSASLPKSSYKIKLVSPYGNSYSQLFNIYMPLAMILAGSLPRNTGASSYISPFFCECYDKGRNNIQLGMISNLSVTRGTSNLAFTRAGHPNAIDVDLTVDSLDEIVSVDVTSNGVLTKALDLLENALSADTPFVGYLNTLAAVDVYTLAFRIPKLRLKFAEAAMNLKAIIDPDPAAYAAMTVGNSPLSFLQAAMGDPSSALQSVGGY